MVDLAYLEEASFGNKDFVLEMIDLFLEQTPQYLERLEQSIDEESRERIKLTGHKMKPTYNMIGLTNLYQAINHIENGAIEGMAISDIKDKMVYIRLETERAFTQLKELRPKYEQ